MAPAAAREAECCMNFLRDRLREEGMEHFLSRELEGLSRNFVGCAGMRIVWREREDGKV